MIHTLNGFVDSCDERTCPGYTFKRDGICRIGMDIFEVNNKKMGCCGGKDVNIKVNAILLAAAEAAFSCGRDQLREGYTVMQGDKRKSLPASLNLPERMRE